MPAQVIKEICLYCSNDYRQDAIWAAAYTDTAYLVVWGARATKYNDRGKKLNLSLGGARAEFEKKVAEKKAKGYFEVGFDQSAYGNVPTFSSLFDLKGSESLTQSQSQSPSSSAAAAGLIVGLGDEVQRVTSALELGDLSVVEQTRLHIREVQIRLVAQVLGVSDDLSVRLSELAGQQRLASADVNGPMARSGSRSGGVPRPRMNDF